MSYANYLLSPEWQSIRKKALKAAKYKCQQCNRHVRLDVHHKRYPKRGTETLKDLEALCRKCHKREHKESKQ